MSYQPASTYPAASGIPAFSHHQPEAYSSNYVPAQSQPFQTQYPQAAPQAFVPPASLGSFQSARFSVPEFDGSDEHYHDATADPSFVPAGGQFDAQNTYSSIAPVGIPVYPASSALSTFGSGNTGVGVTSTNGDAAAHHLAPLGPESEDGHLQCVAIPYQGNQLMFIPINTKTAHPGKIDQFKEKWETKYHVWGTKPPKSIKGRTHAAIKKHFDNETPGQKFVKRVDSHTKELEIFYPEYLSREEVESQLREAIAKANKKNLVATSIFGVGLPVAITVDVLTIGVLFTIFDALFLSVSAKGLSRGLKIKKLVQPKAGADGIQEPPKVELVPNAALQHYMTTEASTGPVIHDANGVPQGIPSDEQIAQICLDLGHPELAKTVRKVRDRQVKLDQKAAAKAAKKANKSGGLLSRIL